MESIIISTIQLETQLFNGIGLIHFGSVFLEIFSWKVNLIKNSGNIFGTPYFESSQPRSEMTLVMS